MSLPEPLAEDRRLHLYFPHHTAAPEQIEADAQFSLACGLEYGRHIARRFGRDLATVPDLSGLRVLELGPGLSFGAALVCRALGAKVSILDAHLVTWHPQYHPQLYSALLTLGRHELQSADWSVLDAVLEAGHHPGAVIEQIAERLDQQDDARSLRVFDAIVSNAVLEHVWDVTAMCRALHEWTAPGGVGIHQVDFRDHSCPDRPLEFLRTADDDYAAIFAEAKGGGGNRVRARELAGELQRAGFLVEEISVNARAEEAYVTRVRPLLQPRFAGMTVQELSVVGARLFVRRAGPFGRDHSRDRE
jgi:hypothetical protein